MKTHQSSSMRTWGLLSPVTLAGISGAVIGFFGGGYIAAVSCDWNIKEAGCVESAVYGSIIGSSVLTPIAAQLANLRRGSFPIFLLTLLAVGGIGAVGLVAAFSTNLVEILIAIPFVQLISCVAIQRGAPREDRV